MKAHDNIAKLIEYLREHPKPFAVAHIVAAGIMDSCDASDAVQYGVRYGVMERIKVPGAAPRDRVQYRWTGQPLPPVKNGARGFSFDALLAAWGIARVPPRLPRHTAPRPVQFDRTERPPVTGLCVTPTKDSLQMTRS